MQATHESITNRLDSNTCPKSRLGVFLFNLMEQKQSRAFVQALIKRIYKARDVQGGIGFYVKLGSFFHVKGGTWVVLISKFPLRLTKWDTIYEGVGAKDMRIFQPNLISDLKGKQWTRNSLFAVKFMFKNVNMTTLTGNRVKVTVEKVYSPTDKYTPRELRSNGNGEMVVQTRERVVPAKVVEDPCTPVRAFARPVDASCDSCTLVEASPIQTPDRRTRATTPMERSASTPGAPRKQLARSFSVEESSPQKAAYSKLVEGARTFLVHDPLVSIGEFLGNVYSFASEGGRKNAVSFLLEGRLVDIFAHYVYLKGFVLSFLSDRYGVEFDGMSVSLIVDDTQFSALCSEDQALLLTAAERCDRIPGRSSFLLLDRFSVAVFLAFCILGEDCEGGASLGEDFVTEHASTIAEHVRMYSDAIVAMSAFMNRQIEQGLLERAVADDYVFLPHINEVEVLGYFLADWFPRNVRSVSDRERRAFRVRTLAAKIPEIAKKFNIKKFGLAYDVWKAMQQAGVFFNQLPPDDSTFCLLPPTRFTRDSCVQLCLSDDGLELFRRVQAFLTPSHD